MKIKILLLGALTFIVNITFGQSRHLDSNKSRLENTTSRTIPIGGNEIMGHFPGTEEDYKNYVNNHLKYPKTNNPQKGVVRLNFFVLEDGSITNIKVFRFKDSTKNLGKEYELAAIELVRSFPKFVPKTINGKKTKCVFFLPVYFK